MKTVEELFEKNICYSYVTASGYKWEVTDLVGVKSIITEHDKEIREMIEKRVNEYENSRILTKDEIDRLVNAFTELLKELQ